MSAVRINNNNEVTKEINYFKKKYGFSVTTKTVHTALKDCGRALFENDLLATRNKILETENSEQKALIERIIKKLKDKNQLKLSI